MKRILCLLFLFLLICISGCSNSKDNRQSMIDSELENLQELNEPEKPKSKPISFYKKNTPVEKKKIQKKASKASTEDRFREYAGYRSLSLLSGREWDKNLLDKAMEKKESGNYEQAISDTESFLYSLNPDNYSGFGQGYMMLAEIYEKMGDSGKEQEAWENFNTAIVNLQKSARVQKYKQIHQSRDDFFKQVYPEIDKLEKEKKPDTNE